ncbi:hypothetical protein Syun_024777 [Stephania yunnanensis]|uniref:Uncharacterized protein n=1 Tax=Stephania yunnanensis TaxID=152371 RepID=A0AAP0ETD7_9MAGN
MKTHPSWRLAILDMIMPAPRHRPPLKRPMWIIVLVSMVSLMLIGAYVYPPRSYAACYIFSSDGCKSISNWLPPAPAREFTDDEIAARVVIRDILQRPPLHSKNPKIAFMFLTPGTLPFERLWDRFFQGHEGRFTIYIHASREKPVHVSQYFVGREIRSDKVVWGKISMVDAERRLLANALVDSDNQHFVLLSDSFEDPGPIGSGRYSEHMLPEVEKKDFRKGAQWFTLKRQHATILMADSLYYTKFKLYCKMVDPGGIANWSVTHVDWSERKWHPKSYRARDVSYELFKNITSIDESVHVTSAEKVKIVTDSNAFVLHHS